MRIPKITRRSFTYYGLYIRVTIRENNREGIIHYKNHNIKFTMTGSSAEISIEDSEKANLGLNHINKFYEELESMIGYDQETYSYYLK